MFLFDVPKNLPPGVKLSDLEPEEPKQETENIHAIGEDDYEREVSQSQD